MPSDLDAIMAMGMQAGQIQPPQPSPAPSPQPYFDPRFFQPVAAPTNAGVTTQAAPAPGPGGPNYYDPRYFTPVAAPTYADIARPATPMEVVTALGYGPARTQNGAKATSAAPFDPETSGRPATAAEIQAMQSQSSAPPFDPETAGREPTAAELKALGLTTNRPPPGWDIETADRDLTPEELKARGLTSSKAPPGWDIETAGNPMPPDQALALLAPLVAKQPTDPQYDKAYLMAYKDYYDQNTLGHRIGQTLADVGSKAVDPDTYLSIGRALWSMAKAPGLAIDQASNPANNVPVGPGVGGYVAAVGRTLASEAGGASKALGQGGLAAYNAAAYAGDQLENAFADITGSPAARDKAAENSLARLKANGTAQQWLNNTFTPPGTNQGAAQIGGGLAQVATAEALPVGGAIRAGGDFLQTGAQYVAGKALQWTPGMAKVAGYAGSAAGLYAHPIAGLVSGAAKGVDAAMGGQVLNPYSIFRNGNALKSGLFQSAATFGDQLVTTPLGKSAIDSIADNSTQIVQDARQKLLGARTEVAAKQAAFDDADANGLNTIGPGLALQRAKSAAQAANAHEFMVSKGAAVAQYFQQKGWSGVPSRLADAVSGAILGGLAGGTLAASQQPPGSPDVVNGFSRGAVYGSILGVLGTGATAGTQRTNSYKPSTSSTTAAGGPSALRDAANASAKNTFVIGGQPITPGALAAGIEDAGKATTAAIAEDAGQASYNYQLIANREDGAWGTLNPRPSDQAIDKLVGLHQPTGSSSIPVVGYDPDSQLLSLRFKKTPTTYHHYVYGEVPPEVHQEFLAGQGAGGSIGKYFNQNFRANYPHVEVNEPGFFSPLPAQAVPATSQ